MNRPSFATRVLGHPVVLLATMAATLFLLYRWTQDSQVWPMAVAALFVANWINTANDRVEQYQAWRRAWDGMADSGAPRRRRGGAHFVAVPLGIAAVGWFISRFEHRILPTILVVALGLSLMIAAKALAAHRARRASAHVGTADEVVTLCAGGPVLPVPSLTQAYRDLPIHCWQVLSKQ